MASEVYILESALEVLRQGGTLTIDAVARQADLTKPGVVHHFATKQVLALAVLDHMLDTWEAGLIARVGTDSSPTDRLRAYVEHTLLGEMDSSDLALVADPKLRDQLVERWTSRMQMWFGVSTTPHLAAARLIADGAWIDRCLGLFDLTQTQRAAVATIALDLIDLGVDAS